MAAIAKAAGVSQGAISSLLNDRDYGIRVSEKTRERVFKVCREMGYIPNDLRALVRMYPELGDLCLLVSSDIGDVAGDPFVSRVVRGVMHAISDPAHALTLAHFDGMADFAEKADALPEPVLSGTTSKFIVAGQLNRSLLQAIIKRGHPAVVLGHEVTIPGVTSILPDYAEASRLAIEYLFGLGHRRIAIMSGAFGTTDQSVIELNRGVRAGYEKIGVPIEAQNIVYGELTFLSGFNAVDVLLDRDPRPTAIFCVSDAVAAGVVARAQSRGLRVPGELSVLGCGDDRHAEAMLPALSTIHLPVEEIGETALREIEARVRLADDGLLEARRVMLPVHLVERASCAAPAEGRTA